MTQEIPKTTKTFIKRCILRMLDEYFDDRQKMVFTAEIKDLIKHFLDKLCDEKQKNYQG